MKIRKLSREEHVLTRPLYEEVFPDDSGSFVDYYYTEKIKDNKIYVIEEDGDIQAMLHLNPYEMSVNGRGRRRIILWRWPRGRLTAGGAIWGCF